MGFGGTPPRLDLDSFLANLAQWTQRADIAALQFEVPWAALLDGASADSLVTQEHLPLVAHYRSRGIKVLLVPELNDGLAREAESSALRAIGRSLTEAPVQDAFRRYVLAAARVLEPDWLCLGVETNLVRLIAPAALYDAIRRCANDAAADLRAAGLPRPPVLVSTVQVETAWGRLGPQDGQFAGVATDRADFAFAQCLGLTSYPYLCWRSPEDIPDDWYGRVVASAGLPAMVTECGWSSETTVAGPSDVELQRRYVERQFDLLDSADVLAVMQLCFADIDVAALAPPLPANLPVLASVGLSRSDLSAKPALAVWDTRFALPLDARQP